MPDPVTAPAPKTDAPPPAADPAKPVETPKPADAAPPKGPESPPPPLGAPAKPAEPAKPADAPKPGDPPKPDADKKETQPRAEDGKFVAAELKVPEGVKVDEKLLDQFKQLAPTIGISTKQAQALLELQVKGAQEQERLITEAMQRQRVDDLNKLKGDPEFGGAKFDQTVAGSKSILSSLKYGPAVSKKLEAYGLDCDPDITRLFAEVRSLIAEDSTSSRLTSPHPVANGAPLTQTERQARTYKEQPK
jgi:hypothetical protein